MYISVVKRPGTSVQSRYKKKENVTVPFFTGGTGDPVQKTQTEPSLKTEFTEFVKVWMN